MAFSNSFLITSDHTKCGGSDSTDFPVLFAGVYDGSGGTPDLRTVANGGQVQNTVSVGGYTVPADVVFSSDNTGTTLLKWQIDFYDPVTGTIVAWFKQPTLTFATDPVAYVVFGDVSTTTWQGDVNGTWNSNFKGRYHFSDGTTVNLTDSTSNARNFTVSSGSLVSDTGKIDGAAKTNNNYATASDTGLPSGASPFTISAWIKSSGSTDCAWWYGTGFNNAVGLRWFAGNLEVIGTNPDVQIADTAPSVLTHYVVRYDGTDVTIWKNGSKIKTDTQAISTTLSGSFYFGVQGWNTTGGFNGTLDELSIADVALSDDWILQEYNNQSSPSTFYTLTSASPVATNVRETSDHIEVAVTDDSSLRETSDHIEVANTQIAALRETSDHIEVATTDTDQKLRVTSDHIEVAVQVLEARCYLDWDLVCDDSLFNQDARCLVTILLKCTGFDPDRNAFCNLHWTLEAIPPGEFTGEKCLTDESGGGGGSGGSYTF